jgi:hypothetical protein
MQLAWLLLITAPVIAAAGNTAHGYAGIVNVCVKDIHKSASYLHPVVHRCHTVCRLHGTDVAAAAVLLTLHMFAACAVLHLLLQQYKWHEPSREAIEGAFDTLLQVGVTTAGLCHCNSKPSSTAAAPQPSAESYCLLDASFHLSMRVASPILHLGPRFK